MSNFDINVDRWTDGQTDGRTEKRMPFVTKSEGQRDVSCKV